MNLQSKKRLAAETLGVGKGRVVFNSERLSEIKEAITRQDMRDLFAAKAISISPIKGRRKIVKRKTRRRFGSIRKKVKHTKESYMNLTRRLRAYITELRKQEKITSEQYSSIRKQIKSGIFKSKSHFKEVALANK